MDVKDKMLILPQVLFESQQLVFDACLFFLDFHFAERVLRNKSVVFITFSYDIGSVESFLEEVVERNTLCFVSDGNHVLQREIWS